MKYLLVIGDGMADNPVPALGDKTPLEAAKIPAIDALAARGVVGSVVNCPPQLPAGSETGILSEAVQPLFADLCAATNVWREDNAQEVTITENEHKISNDRYEIQRGTLTFRESKRTTLHKPLAQGATFDQTFDTTFD